MEIGKEQRQAIYRVCLKREIRRMSGLPLNEEVRNLPTEKLEELFIQLNKNGGLK
jgi:hypothetical protein